MTRVAAIDIGTNTVLLLIAERGQDGALRPTIERETITRLGEGADATGRLSPAAIARTLACVDAYARIVEAADVQKVGVVGTSAMRSAEGGDAVRDHVARVLGTEARVLSGIEEARLAFAGALEGIDARIDGNIVVFDIGGGSTEVATGRRGEPARAAWSFDLGSVRLTERHVRGDPPAPHELRAIQRDVRSAFAALPVFEAGATFVGIAGTMTTLASVSKGLPSHDGDAVHGATLTLDALRIVAAELAAMPLLERRAARGIEPLRADVIVAGSLVALGFLEGSSASTCLVSNRGVRWGLAQSLFDAP